MRISSKILAFLFLVSFLALPVAHAREAKPTAAATAAAPAPPPAPDAKTAAPAGAKKAGEPGASKPAAGAATKVDINTAPEDDLKALPGIGDAYSKKIVASRPYAKKDQLVSKGVLPAAVYKKIKDLVVATQK